MELDQDHLAVLDIYREHDIEIGQCLATGTLNRERLKLPQGTQQNWGRVIGELTRQGYIYYHPKGYGLTRKGYAQIGRGLGSRCPVNQESSAASAEASRVDTPEAGPEGASAMKG